MLTQEDSGTIRAGHSADEDEGLCFHNLSSVVLLLLFSLVSTFYSRALQIYMYIYNIQILTQMRYQVIFLSVL